MNYVRSEVTGTAIDCRYIVGESVPQESSAGAPIAGMEQFLSVISTADANYSQQTGRRRASSSGLAPWQMLRVRNYVESALSEDIRVGALAAIAKLSTSHFARAFRASFGSTPAAYVVTRRIERAKSMMLETTESLCRISLDCGFTDQSHLSRTFLRQVGQSPSRWRRWHRTA